MPLIFRRIETSYGPAYRAFNDDFSLAFTVRRRVNGDFSRRYPWEFFIQRTTTLTDGVYIPDAGKPPIKDREHVKTRADAYTYCRAYAESALPLGSYKRNLEAWAAVNSLDE